MRTFFSSLLILALPAAGAVPGSGGTDVGTQADHVVPKGSGAFLDPSSVFKSIHAYLPRVLRETSAIQVLAAREPYPPDFWDMAKKSEVILQYYIPRLLQNATSHFKSTKFTDLTSAMNHIVSTTSTFRGDIEEALDARHTTLDTLTKEFEGIFMAVVNELEKIPLPDKALGHAEREKLVDKILDDTMEALKILAVRYGLEEKVVENYMAALKPQVKALIVTVGDINEQYPELFPMLAFSIAALLIPESWILRPFLSLFGFGPMGPAKGSPAAWLQRRFWGAAVQPGSWFSWLQAAGMGVIPRWAGLAIKVSLGVGTALATLLPCLCKRG